MLSLIKAVVSLLLYKIWFFGSFNTHIIVSSSSMLLFNLMGYEILNYIQVRGIFAFFIGKICYRNLVKEDI